MKTPISRREALVAIAVASAAGVLPVGAEPRKLPSDTLSALVDTLLPGDEASPSAVSLGIDAEIADLVRGNELPERLFAYGLEWLDAVAGRRFSQLGIDDRERVVAVAAGSDFDQIPGRFYYLARLLAMQLYYDKPQAVGGLPLNPTPQPDGYPPPWT